MNEQTTTKVVIVIVTWNAVKWLADCLSSLRQSDFSGLDVRLIIVDNASADGSAKLARELYPTAQVVENERNLGFAGGNNVGLRLALDAGADYVYLLNQDTEVESDFLRTAVVKAAATPEAAAWQSLLLLHPDRQLINSSGNAIHFLGFGYCLDYRRALADWRPPTDGNIAYASGAGVLLRGAALRAVGLFDEELFLYHEDLELSWRLRAAGWSVLLAPSSKVYHKYEFSRSVSKFYWMERNRYLVLFKCLEPWTLLLLAPWLVLLDAALLLTALRGGWWREKIKVYDYFMTAAAWEKVSRDRAAWRQLRRVSDWQLTAGFVATIEHQETAGPLTRLANRVLPWVWRLTRQLMSKT